MENSQTVNNKEKKKYTLKSFLGDVFVIVLAILVSIFVTVFIAQQTQVIGSSMEPQLQTGDRLITNKMAYRFSEPERFDVIVFTVGKMKVNGQSTHFIKRIIGLPGETVQIKEDGTILINGEVLEEDYGLETIAPYNIGLASEEILVGEDEYFVLGDNRNNSEDSRGNTVKNVAKDTIIGKAVFRFWPFDNIGSIK